MNGIQSVKPESFGKGKKKGEKKKSSSNTKFYLKAYLTSTQHKGSYNIDLRTVDVSFNLSLSHCVLNIDDIIFHNPSCF